MDEKRATANSKTTGGIAPASDLSYAMKGIGCPAITSGECKGIRPDPLGKDRGPSPGGAPGADLGVDASFEFSRRGRRDSVCGLAGDCGLCYLRLPFS